jgi:hypothetical protein
MSYTWASLKAEMVTKVEDQSDDYLSALDGIVSDAEIKTLRDLDLEVFQGEVTGNSLTAHNRLFARPSGVVKISALWLLQGASRKFIEKRSKGYCEMYAEDDSVESFPKFYAEQDVTNLYFVNTPDQAYEVVIYGIERPAGLSESVNTTWLSTYVPDLLLLNALILSEEYLTNPDQIAIWKGDYGDRLPAAKLEFAGMQRSDYEAMK